MGFAGEILQDPAFDLALGGSFLGLPGFDFTSNRPRSFEYHVAVLAEHPMASEIFDLG